MIVGRKIWLSAGSDQGRHRVASIFGLIVTAKLIGVDPETLAGIALDAYRAVETRTVVFTCFGLAGALALMPALVWSRRNRLPEEADAGGGLLRALSLLLRPRFCLGALCICPYVGAEVAIGSLIVSYLAQPGVLGLTDLQAGKRVPLYWGGALAGRFVGAYVLGWVSPGNVLTVVAAGAIALMLVSANTTGALSSWSLLTTALWNSIMFPTIFSLASEGLGRRAEEGSGLIATAIVGGAVVPPLTGHLADASGSLQFALILPALCYAVIAGYGTYARRPADSTPY